MLLVFIIGCVISLKLNNWVEAARILAVFPTPSISHQKIFRPFTQELARRGHEVVVITTDTAFPKEGAPENITEIDVHDISYTHWREFVLESSKGKKDDLISKVNLSVNLLLKIFEKQLEVDKIMKLISSSGENFDLLLIEACVKPAVSLSHIFKVPVIQVSSFGSFDNYDSVGVATHPILYPTWTHQKLYNLSLLEKITEIYNHFMFEKMFNDHNEKVNKVLRQMFGQDIPDVKELNNNVDMLLVNLHSIWEDCRPVPPNVIFMGGLIDDLDEESIPQDLKSYLDSSINGVIYVSFGTNVQPSLLPPEKIEILTKVLSHLPYDVLLKWDTDELIGQSKNIRTAKWWPQPAILKHPNTKLFITQGGLHSTEESIAAGVPMIGIPMLGDQWYNVEKYIHLGIGIKLDIETLTEEELRNGITNVIGDVNYRSNVLKLRRLLRDQPQSALRRAADCVERAMRRGTARHMRAPAANMAAAEYFELELIFFSFLMLLVVIIIIVFVIRYIIKKFYACKLNYLSFYVKLGLRKITF